MQVEIAPRIVVDANVRFGKPVIKGTRVPVELVFAHLEAGMSPSEIVAEYGIRLADVEAARAYPGVRRAARKARRAQRRALSRAHPASDQEPVA